MRMHTCQLCVLLDATALTAQHYRSAFGSVHLGWAALVTRLIGHWVSNCVFLMLLNALQLSAAHGKPRCLLQVKLNTDDSPEVATKYGIRSIPTVMLFKGGQKLDTIIGAVPKDILMKAIQKVLN